MVNYELDHETWFYGTVLLILPVSFQRSIGDVESIELNNIGERSRPKETFRGGTSAHVYNKIRFNRFFSFFCFLSTNSSFSDMEGKTFITHSLYRENVNLNLTG